MTALRTPAEIRAEIERVSLTGERIGRGLIVVVAGALVFTCVNVTLFATDHGTPWFIAWLLDPLASVAFLAALIGDSVLSRYGIKPGAWPTALKLVAGGFTWAMNIWHSVEVLDWASIVLHSVAPALVIGLAEATPIYRRKFAEIVRRLEIELGEAIEAIEAERIAARASIIGTGTGAGSIDPRASNGSTPRPRPDRDADQQESSPIKRRTIEDLRVELADAIEAGDLDPQPSAESIRRVLSIAPARARVLRDELAGGSSTSIERPALTAVPRSTPDTTTAVDAVKVPA